MSSVHEFISALSLPSDTIQKLEVWLYHPDNGWHPTDPVDEAFYAISDEHLVQAGLTTRERRSFLAKLKAAAGTAAWQRQLEYYPGKKVLGAPSSVAKPQSVKKLQEQGCLELGVSKNTFLLHRPAEARAIPFALLHPAFGHFLDDVDSLQPTPRDYEYVVRFAHDVAALYNIEDERRDRFNKILEDYFESRSERMDMNLGTPGRPPYTDGTFCVNGIPHTFLKIKQEPGQGDGDPLVETIVYKYHHINLDGYGDYLMPSLSIEVVGPDMRISGLANVGRVASEPLTPALHMLDLRPHQPVYMERLAPTFAALRKAANFLRSEYRADQTTWPRAVNVPYLLTDRPVGVWAVPDPDPAVATAAEHGQLAAALQQHASRGIVTMDGILEARLQRDLQLECVGLPADSPLRLVQSVLVQTPDRLLYEQPQPDGSIRLLKFATRYGSDVHRTLAAAGLAPALFDVQALPGGWLMVIMELLDSTWQTLEECMLTVSGPEWAVIEAAVISALEQAHQQELPGGGKLVRADARPTNVMVRMVDGEAEVRFLDFDWSGSEGNDTYPGFMNHQDLEWPLGVRAGLPLKQVHDLQMMQKTIGSHVRKRPPLTSACARKICSPVTAMAPRVSFSWGSSWRTRLCL